MVMLHMKDSREYLSRRVTELHIELRQGDMSLLARKSGAVYENGRFLLDVWGTAVTVTPPDFMARRVDTGASLDTMTQALLAYYFVTTDGTLPSGQWVGFTELADGRFYTAAFQSYTGQELARVFGNNGPAFVQAAQRRNGRAVPFADHAFVFPVLPFVSLLVACWLGDEEFPASYRILFDAHINHHLPTDACAILGSTLARQLINQVG